MLFTDNSQQDVNFVFNEDISEWQFNTGMIKASSGNANKTLSYIRVRLVYYYNANTAYFDDISLNIDKTGTSYTYDGNGNVVTAADNAKREKTTICELFNWKIDKDKKETYME